MGNSLSVGIGLALLSIGLSPFCHVMGRKTLLSKQSAHIVGMSRQGNTGMDMQWLEDVLVLLEEGNMSRAAQRRNITQPAFSRRIRGFETWLGTPVLKRGSNSIEIGAALHANEAEIRALTARLRDLKSKVSQFDPGRSTVSIAAQHAPVLSAFADMATYAKHQNPKVSFSLKAGNQRDCVTMFLRGDAQMLLCYQSENAEPLPFGDQIARDIWGHDLLVPVIGAQMHQSPDHIHDLPAIVYPEDSYFGEVLTRSKRQNGTRAFSLNPVCETAFSSGVKDMVLKGLGVGWLPFRMIHEELATGTLVSLAQTLGQEPLTITLYAHSHDEAALALLKVWSASARLSHTNNISSHS
ncbi:MAG: LysR family transcriptional regulator [Sedimentitalea sp.]